MLRQTLARSAWRTGKQAANASRAFSVSAQRPADVELTIGESGRAVIEALVLARRLTVV